MIERILVGTATSEDAAAVLHAAAELAGSHAAELIVLHVEPMIDARLAFDPDGVPEPERQLLPLLRRSYPGLRVSSHRARGCVVRIVCRVAEQERADLILVPQGRFGRTGALLSQRASRALAHQAPCPVLLVAS